MTSRVVGRALCRHCAARVANRPRGLCWGCYYAPGVKALYPSTSKYARRGVGPGKNPSGLPPERSGAMPGTPEKMAVLALRAAAGLSLFRSDEPWVGPAGGPVETAIVRAVGTGCGPGPAVYRGRVIRKSTA